MQKPVVARYTRSPFYVKITDHEIIAIISILHD